MFDLAFEADTHTYSVGSVVMPSVTQVIQPLYDFRFVDEATLRAAGSFGTAVHRVCELHDLDDLVLDSVDEPLRPYLKAWQRFLEHTGAKVLQVEQRYYHKQLGYAGTLDRVLEIYGETVLADIKSVSQLSRPVGVQLAGYEKLLADNTEHGQVRRAAVQLCPDATYRLRFFTNPRDLPAFLSLLTLHNWRKQDAE